MMNRKRRFLCTAKTVALVCVAWFSVSTISAQEADTDNGKGEGFVATIDMSADIFDLTKKTFAYSDLRGPAAQDHTIVHWPISNFSFSDNAKAYIGYNGKYFGGRFGFQPQSNGNVTTFGGLVNAWARFSFLRLTMGNDIATSYADALGADPGLRIYDGRSWDSYTNPDNITQGEGLLAEAMFDRFTLALAAGDFVNSIKFTNRITGNSDRNEYLARFDTSFRYGGSLIYEMGDLGKLNASYMLKGLVIADAYNIKGQNSPELVPFQADAKVLDHALGLYGSLRLSDSLSVTLGYNALMTQYLNEFWNPVESRMVETGVPNVLKHGLNLNAKFAVNDRVTLITDNNVTLWQDKNYESFETGRANWNYNTQPKSRADSVASVNYLVLWNGLGMSYALTERMTGSVYARNLFSNYSAHGNTPGGKQDYSFVRNQSQFKIRLDYIFNQQASVWTEVVLENMITSRSEGLNGQSSGIFLENTTVNGRPVQKLATRDNVFVVRIPIGITLHLK